MINTTSTSGTDAMGNPVSGPADAIDRYDHAIDRLLRYHPDVVPAMEGLVTDSPDFPMGQVLMAYLCLTSTDAPDVAPARDAVAALAALELNDRERAHLGAASAWASGDWLGASKQLDGLLVRWPSDPLALLVGHQLDFFLGDARNLRDRIGRALLNIDPDHPHHAFVRGMYSFGLEESGHYQQSEEHGLAALEVHPDDVWAVHAVVHTYEMTGRVDDGIRFLRQREGDWSRDNLFTVHNWWHLALYLLEAGRPAEALSTYDAQVHNEASAGVPIEMLDASALLWRFALDGADTGGRFGPLADAWATRTSDEPWYAFNDLHAVMALVGDGRIGDARAVIERLERYVNTAPTSRSNVVMTAEIGLPACRAIVAYDQGRDADVLAELLPIRRVFQHFGGSHAQRDALQRTILTSAIRSGRYDLAKALLSERLSVRETSVYSRRRWAEVLQETGDPTGSEQAEQVADRHQARFAAAAG